MDVTRRDLQSLANVFCARDIMVPKEKLIFARSKKEAVDIADNDSSDFDVIPVVNRRNEIIGYYDRELKEFRSIHHKDLISNGA
ncbi:MAG: hypothetical protein DRN01_06860, partial [Thermoplasmata archaeon]